MLLKTNINLFLNLKNLRNRINKVTARGIMIKNPNAKVELELSGIEIISANIPKHKAIIRGLINILKFFIIFPYNNEYMVSL